MNEKGSIIDISFLYALLIHGKVGDVIACGVLPEMLKGDASNALKFTIDYTKQHMSIPDIQVVSEYTGIKFDKIEKGDLGFWIKEIKQRQLYGIVREELVNITNHMNHKDSFSAVDAVEQLLKRARKEQLTRTRVINLFSLGEQVLKQYEKYKNGEYGIISPWATVNRHTLGWQPGDFALFNARFKVGKCVKYDTPMFDSENGRIVSIQEIVEKKRPILKWEDKIESYLPDAHIYTGEKQCNRIYFKNGQDISCTPEHPFLGIDKEQKKIEDGSLYVGDYVAVASRIPFPKKTKTIEEDILIVNALMMTDGGLTGHGSTFTKGDKVLIKMMEDALFYHGFKLKPRKNDKYAWDILSDGKKGNSFLNNLPFYSLTKDKSKDKKVPDFVYGLNKEQLRIWIGLFWSCDGDIPNSKGTELTLASKELVYGIRHLLLRLGVYGRIKPKKAICNGKEFKAWRLSIRGRYLDIFLDEIPLYGEKFNKWNKENCKSNKENDVIPCSEKIKTRIDEIISQGEKKGITMVDVGYQLGKKDIPSIKKRSYRVKTGETKTYQEDYIIKAGGICKRRLFNKKGMILLKRFTAFCRVFKCEDEFKWMWTDIDWEPITEIKDDGIQKVYDLTINKGHWFIANDIVVHNTWVMLMLAKHAWIEGRKVLMISSEMSQISLATRFTSLYLKYSYGKVRQGKLGAIEEPEFYEAVRGLSKQENLYILGDDFSLNITEVDAALNELKPDLCIIDGAYLLQIPGVKDRFDKAPIIADELKIMAKKHKLPVLASMQFNNKVVGMKSEDLDGSYTALSASFSWNVDYSFALIRDKEHKTNREMFIKTLAARECEPFDFKINWDFDKMDFTEKTKCDESNSENKESGEYSDDIPF